MLAEQKWQVETIRVLENVFSERKAQVDRYGHNEANPDGTGPDTAWLEPYTYSGAAAIEESLRLDYEGYAAEAPVTWVHLVREEIAEAFMEDDPAKLEAELTQVAALCVSWVEQLRARGRILPVEEGLL